MKKTGSDPFISRYLLSPGQGNEDPTKERARQTGIASAVRIKAGEGAQDVLRQSGAAALIQNEDDRRRAGDLAQRESAARHT